MMNPNQSLAAIKQESQPVDGDDELQTEVNSAGETVVAEDPEAAVTQDGKSYAEVQREIEKLQQKNNGEIDIAPSERRRLQHELARAK